MSDDWPTDAELVMDHGPCGICGAPRILRKVITSIAWPVHTELIDRELLCSRDASHDPYLLEDER